MGTSDTPKFLWSGQWSVRCPVPLGQFGDAEHRRWLMPELDIAFVLNLIRSYMQSLLTGMLQRLDSRANKGVPYNPTLFILCHFFMLKG